VVSKRPTYGPTPPEQIATSVEQAWDRGLLFVYGPWGLLEPLMSLLPDGSAESLGVDISRGRDFICFLSEKSPGLLAAFNSYGHNFTEKDLAGVIAATLKVREGGRVGVRFVYGPRESFLKILRTDRLEALV
jgi:hypothetical protein